MTDRAEEVAAGLASGPAAHRVRVRATPVATPPR